MCFSIFSPPYSNLHLLGEYLSCVKAEGKKKHPSGLYEHKPDLFLLFTFYYLYIA